MRAAENCQNDSTRHFDARSSAPARLLVHNSNRTAETPSKCCSYYRAFAGINGAASHYIRTYQTQALMLLDKAYTNGNLGMSSPSLLAAPAPALAHAHSAAHFIPHDHIITSKTTTFSYSKQPKSCFCIPVIAVVLTLYPQEPESLPKHCCENSSKQATRARIRSGRLPKHVVRAHICTLRRASYHANARDVGPSLRAWLPDRSACGVKLECSFECMRVRVIRCT